MFLIFTNPFFFAHSLAALRRSSLYGADIAKLNRIQLHLDDLVTQMGTQLYEGQIDAQPLVTSKNPCSFCDYSFICCHETGIGERALDAPAKPFEPEESEETGKEGEDA